MKSIYDNNAEQRSRCADLPARVWILQLLTSLILLLCATFSCEFSLSPGWGLYGIDSCHTFLTMHQWWRAGRALVHVRAGSCHASVHEQINFFLLAALRQFILASVLGWMSVCMTTRTGLLQKNRYRADFLEVFLSGLSHKTQIT